MRRFPFPRSQCLGRAFCDVRDVRIVSHCFVYFDVLDVRDFIQALFRESHPVWDPFIRVRGPSNGLTNQRGRDGCRGAVDARCGGAVRSAWGHAGVGVRGPNFVSIFFDARSVLRSQQTLMHALQCIRQRFLMHVL